MHEVKAIPVVLVQHLSNYSTCIICGNHEIGSTLLNVGCLALSK